jgi:DNA polymerase I-like protein with 3'-5' exonuclease and polymerase domains
MVDCYREVDNDEECRLLLQVHDSLVWEIKEGREEYYLPRIAEVMTRPSEDFGVRLDVDAHQWSK